MGWSRCANKQNIEACRLYFKIERTPENRLVDKWSSGQVCIASRGNVDFSHLCGQIIYKLFQNMELSVKNLVKIFEQS